MGALGAHGSRDVNLSAGPSRNNRSESGIDRYLAPDTILGLDHGVETLEQTADDTRVTGLLLQSPDSYLTHGSTSLYASAALLEVSPIETAAKHPLNPIDAVISRDVLVAVLELHFAYVHALIPCIHKPSLMADLRGRREEKPGEQEWSILILVIVASALAQLPSAFLPIGREDAKTLLERITGIGKRYMTQDYQKPTLTCCEHNRLYCC